MKSVFATKALGEAVDLVMGQAPPSKDCNFDEKGTPFVKVGEFDEVRPVIREWTTNPLRMARRTDVLLCVVGATCGKINLGEECAIGRSVAAIRPHPQKLNQFYLYYFMMTLIERLRSGSVGAAQTVISKEMVGTVQIPLPPLPEQERIVGILDEAFEGIATAKANAEKNLQNARALFQSHLNAVFNHRSEGWVEKRLGELAQLKGRIGWRGLTAKEYTKSGPLFLSVHSLNYGDYVDFRDAFHISEERYDESPEIMLQKDDVLICKDGAGIGKCGIVGALPDRTTINSSLLLIRSGKAILPKFLYRCLCSPYFQRIVNSRLNGATTPHLYQRDITEFPVFLPPLPQQQKIVTQLDAFSADTQRLESIYQQKLAALAALKKSLLHQAFTGEL